MGVRSSVCHIFAETAGANGANVAPQDPQIQCPSLAKGGKFCLIAQHLKFQARRENATSCRHDTAK